MELPKLSKYALVPSSELRVLQRWSTVCRWTYFLVASDGFCLDRLVCAVNSVLDHTRHYVMFCTVPPTVEGLLPSDTVMATQTWTDNHAQFPLLALMGAQLVHFPEPSLPFFRRDYRYFPCPHLVWKSSNVQPFKALLLTRWTICFKIPQLWIFFTVCLWVLYNSQNRQFPETLLTSWSWCCVFNEVRTEFLNISMSFLLQTVKWHKM
jgi:hypothetical protein